MSQQLPYSCGAIEPLLSGYLDEELTQQEGQQVRIHLANCASCQQQLADITAIQDALRSELPGATDKERVMAIVNDKPSILMQRLGWLLLLVTIIPLSGYGAYLFWIDIDVPMWVRFVVSGFWLGLVVLFVSVARQRFIAAKTDRYKRVQL
ncbi:MAG TPA: anti-sigma factor [Pseudidiomarina sp.]|nr:anti-sigma factor [Pseudidiomarina sp.]